MKSISLVVLVTVISFSLAGCGVSKNKDIQTALKASNFYTGTIDGKIGPKTKKAIVEFQKAHGLKADGKVGSKTWMELEKYLTTQR